MFFHYSQNNSGGSFRGPAEHVIVEANSGKDANCRAHDVGVYFNGIDSGSDCSCCGDRWYRKCDDDGNDEPMIYGKPVAEGEAWMIGGVALVYHLDGRKEEIKLKERKS